MQTTTDISGKLDEGKEEDAIFSISARLLTRMTT